MSDQPVKELYRWKGRWVSKKVYNKKKELAERRKSVMCKNRQRMKDEVQEAEGDSKESEDKIREAKIVLNANGTKEIIRLPEIETVYYQNPDDENSELDLEESIQENEQENKVVEGRRIVNIAELGRQLWCGTCKEALSLSYVERESRRGYGSLLLIRCHKCLIVNEVTTSKMHSVNTDQRATRFDINTDLALGILNSGISLSIVNKIHEYLKIPVIQHSTYKKYVEEIGEEEIAAIKARRNKSGPVLEEES